MERSKEQYEKLLREQLNDCLEHINAENSIKKCEVNLIDKTVTFTFDIVEYVPDDWISFYGY